MSALDDARTVLEDWPVNVMTPRRYALAALVAECEALLPLRHGDTGGRLLSDDEDPIPS